MSSQALSSQTFSFFHCCSSHKIALCLLPSLLQKYSSPSKWVSNSTSALKLFSSQLLNFDGLSSNSGTFPKLFPFWPPWSYIHMTLSQIGSRPFSCLLNSSSPYFCPQLSTPFILLSLAVSPSLVLLLHVCIFCCLSLNISQDDCKYFKYLSIGSC